MPGAHMLIWVTAALLSGSCSALTANESKVTATNGVTTASTTAQPAANLLAGNCPDGFANVNSGNKCCSSQAVKQFNKAKLLCEAEPGWKAFEASPEVFNCCPTSAWTPSHNVAAPAPSSEKAKEVPKVKVAPAAPAATRPAPTDPSLEVPDGKVHVRKMHARAMGSSTHDGGKGEVHFAVFGRNLHKEGIPINEFDSNSFEHKQKVQKHPAQSHIPNGHGGPGMTVDDPTLVIERDEKSNGWETWHYCIMAVVIVVVWQNFPAGAKDMRHVCVPGYGVVNMSRGGKNPECSDLFEAGYTTSSYGGATMQPMKNMADDYKFNNFNDDDIGL